MGSFHPERLLPKYTASVFLIKSPLAARRTPRGDMGQAVISFCQNRKSAATPLSSG